MKHKQLIKNIGERDISLSMNNEPHLERIALIGKALSSPARLQIMNYLKVEPKSIQEIAAGLGLPVSSTALHISILEEARLVVTESQPGLRGTMRVCLCTTESILINVSHPDFDPAGKSISVEMPVGGYHSWDVEATCGLADENGLMEHCDTPIAFYSPHRLRAQLLWFQQGYVEYRFPNSCDPIAEEQEISFSMELCSEAPGYMENWPSSITISVNGNELGTYCSPGDFGRRRGLLTPEVWQYGRTQYGLLKTFSVRGDGGYIDGELVNPALTIADLALKQHPYISLLIEIRPDAQYVGGINIFGERYGDYAQGIIMRIVY